MQKSSQPKASTKTSELAQAGWLSNLNFYMCYTGWILFWPFSGALIISLVDKLPFINCIFNTISAVTSTGLSTIDMRDLSRGSFVVLMVVMLMGGTLTLALGPMLYRRYLYSEIKKTFPKNLLMSSNPTISEFDLQDRALWVMIRTSILYIFGLILVTWASFVGALYLKPIEPELEERGYNREFNAVFLVISAINNAGFSISTSSVEYLYNNPIAYLILCVPMLAGNTMAPAFYRLIIWAECSIREKYKWDSAPHRYILDNPRRIATNTKSYKEACFVFFINSCINSAQYICFLSSCLHRADMEKYGSRWVQAGMGFFQSIATRNTGLQITNLLNFSQGMLLVYAICMYLSGAPFISALYQSMNPEHSTAEADHNDVHEKYELIKGEEDSSLSLTLTSTAPLNSSSGSDMDVIDFVKKLSSISVATEAEASVDPLPPARIPKRFDAFIDGEKFMAQYILRHAFFICSSVFICAFSEDWLIQASNGAVSLFYVIFEVISAYGTVGLSVPASGMPYSLSGAFSVCGKIVLMLTMLLGKHRGLPGKHDDVIDFHFKRLKRAVRKLDRGGDSRRGSGSGSAQESEIDNGKASTVAAAREVELVAAAKK